MANINKNTKNLRLKATRLISGEILDLLGIYSSDRAKVADALKLVPSTSIKNYRRLLKIKNNIENDNFKLINYIRKKPEALKIYNENFKTVTKIVDKKTGNVVSAKDVFAKIFNTRSEFYEENKDFFRATGGGTHANRNNKEWRDYIRHQYWGSGIKGKNKYAEKYGTWNNSKNQKPYVVAKTEKLDSARDKLMKEAFNFIK